MPWPISTDSGCSPAPSTARDGRRRTTVDWRGRLGTGRSPIDQPDHRRVACPVPSSRRGRPAGHHRSWLDLELLFPPNFCLRQLGNRLVLVALLAEIEVGFQRLSDRLPAFPVFHH